MCCHLPSKTGENRLNLFLNNGEVHPSGPGTARRFPTATSSIRTAPDALPVRPPVRSMISASLPELAREPSFLR